MKTQRVGDSDLAVSVLSLGTMTFGGETTPKDAEAQMDFAVNNGINLIDTAEIYPAPLSPKTYGDSESLIGNWITKRKTETNSSIHESRRTWRLYPLGQRGQVKT